jgi:hypothetical protein
VSWEPNEGEGFIEEQPQDTGEGEGEAPAPTLDDFEDPDVRGQVERLLAAREAEQEARLAEIGLGLGRDGRPMVADTSKVTGWLGPMAAPQGGGNRQPPPVEPPPATQGAPEPEPEQELDWYNMDARTFRQLVAAEAKRVAAEMVKPVQESLTQQQQWAQQRATRDGLAQVKDDLARYAPQISPEIVDHPDFAEAFLHQSSFFQPQQLEDPRGRASIAGMVAAFLDPNKQPKPRDAAGRFANSQAAAEALVNRQFLAANAPSQGGRSQQGGGVTVSREDEAFLRGMERHIGSISSSELAALEHADYESYTRAMQKAQQRGRR